MSSQVPALVKPVISLALWTFAMETWMYSYRIPDIYRYKIIVTPDSTIDSFNAKIPRARQWPADNYNHLHEQPTVFYAVALSLVFLGDANEDPLCLALAWGYVAARVVHSLEQALANRIMVRFPAFVVSSLVLFGLTARAAVLAF